MARYKIIDRSPRFLPVVLDAQLMSGSFEYALDYLIDHQLDLGALDRRYRNDDTGSTAYDPRVLLKIILLAYSRGMISSRILSAPAARMSCLWPSPAIAHRNSPPWPNSCANCAAKSPSCSPKCS